MSLRLRTLRNLFGTLLVLCCAGGLRLEARAAGRPHVIEIDVHDTLQPMRARVFAQEMREADVPGVPLILVNLSTPGGMAGSADQMVAAIRASHTPVAVWAGMPATRITGEGLRLLAAADVALLRPDTYLTPLWTETPRRLSADERAAAGKRLLNELAIEVKEHGRSPSALDELTSGIHWFTADEARQAGFIDGVASSENDVLRMVQGRTFTRNGRTSTLNVTAADVDVRGTSTRDLLMLTLMNPDLAVLLLTLGLLLIYLEINTPGIVVPGAAGVLLILLAAFALSMMPLSLLGLSLCALSVLLLMLESRLRSHGLLALCGIAALVAGLGLLVRGPLPELEVGWATAVGAGIGFGGVTACLLVLGLEARRDKVRTGADSMLGWLAVAQTPLAPDGKVLVRGELWRARLTTQDSSVMAGERVKVLRADGLVLEVTAIPASQTA